MTATLVLVHRRLLIELVSSGLQCLDAVLLPVLDTGLLVGVDVVEGGRPLAVASDDSVVRRRDVGGPVLLDYGAWPSLAIAPFDIDSCTDYPGQPK